MISIKRSVSFQIEKDSRHKSPGTARVRCCISWTGLRLRFDTGYIVSADDWSKEMQRCKPRTCHGTNKTPANIINSGISEIENKLYDIFSDYERQEIVPDKDMLKESVNVEIFNIRKEGEDTSIFPVYDKYIEDGITSGRWGIGSVKKIKIVRQHLYAISPQLSFEDLGDDGILKIVKYLSTLPDKNNEMGLTNPTIKKEIRVVKTFVRWAEEHGYCDCGHFLKQKPHLKSSARPVIFLNWEELMRVYDYDFGNKNYLSQVRDVFCFCCFTSLRYSDAKNLRWSDISDTSFTITTIKTNDKISIELNKYSRAILDKYRRKQFPDGRALPVISNQRMNDYLKDIGRICGIDEPITLTTYKGAQRIDRTFPKYELLSSHAGRRTFICNALTLGIPAEVVMKWTGHSDYKAMKPYIDIADNVRRAAMALFDDT